MHHHDPPCGHLPRLFDHLRFRPSMLAGRYYGLTDALGAIRRRLVCRLGRL